MIFKLARITRNNRHWQRPSSGRLNDNNVGDYVREHGFGHEDWNLNTGLAENGFVYGYSYGAPALRMRGKRFTVVLATFAVNEGWLAIGYYRNAVFAQDGARFSAKNLDERARSLKHLNDVGHLGGKYEGASLTELKVQLRDAAQSYRWKTRIENVIAFSRPLKIPTSVFDPQRQRMTVSYNFTEEGFKRLLKLAKARNLILTHNEVSDEDDRDRPHSPREDPDLYDDPVEIDFETEEGKQHLRQHLRRERSTTLLARFRKGLTSFQCAVCSFDFEATYGEIGRGFIECHHVRPIASLRPGEKTTLSDLVGLCANCHRMMHKAFLLEEASLLKASDLKAHIESVSRKAKKLVREQQPDQRTHHQG